MITPLRARVLRLSKLCKEKVRIISISNSIDSSNHSSFTKIEIKKSQVFVAFQDNLIEKLAKEVRQVNKKSGIVLEADQMISKSASEEYNRPLTPLNVPSSDEVLFTSHLSF